MSFFRWKATLACGVALSGLLSAASALAQQLAFDVPSQSATQAIPEFARQASVQIVAPGSSLRGVQTNAIKGQLDVRAALRQLLAGTGLTFRDDNGAILIVKEPVTGPKPIGAGLTPANLTAQANPIGDRSAFIGTVHTEEVIVTANRRAQNLRDVPANVAVVTGQKLERQAATGFEDYLRDIPGVQFNKSTPQNGVINIRGVTTASTSGTTQQPVGIYIDETPFTDVFSFLSVPDLTPFDLNRVEILRGPQGALYGSGSMGGAIRYVTEKPKADRFEAKVNSAISFTEDGSPSHLVQAMINVPLSEDFAVRGVISRVYDGGYVDSLYKNKRDANTVDTPSGRLLARWTPTDKLTLTGSFLYQKSTTDGATLQTTPPDQNPVDGRNRDYTFDYAYKVANLTAEYDLGFSNLLSTTSYTQKKKTSLTSTDPTATLAARDAALRGILGSAYTPGSLLKAGVGNAATHGNPKSDGYYQELRLTSSGADRFGWMFGGLYSNILNSNPLQQFFPGLYRALNSYGPTLPATFGVLPNDQTLVFSEHSRAREVALYAELRYKITDQFEVTAGGRWFDNDVHSNLSLSNRTLADITTKVRDFMPKVNVAWRATPDFMAYATVSRGYRVGGVNDTIGLALQPGQSLDQVGPPLQYTTDNLWNYEAGFKSSWLNRRVTFDVSVFYIDWSDLQLSSYFPAPLSPSGQVAAITNVGTATSKGIEVAASADLTSALRVTTALSWNDATLGRAVTGLPDPITGRSVTVAAGTRLPGSREWQVATTLAYTAPIGEATGIFTLTHQWASASSSDLVTGISLPANHFVDAQANLFWGDGWEAGMFGRNLLDSRKAVTIFPSSAQGATLYGIPKPRTIGLRLAKMF